MCLRGGPIPGPLRSTYFHRLVPRRQKPAGGNALIRHARNISTGIELCCLYNMCTLYMSRLCLYLTLLWRNRRSCLAVPPTLDGAAEHRLLWCNDHLERILEKTTAKHARADSGTNSAMDSRAEADCESRGCWTDAWRLRMGHNPHLRLEVRVAWASFIGRIRTAWHIRDHRRLAKWPRPDAC